jgi:hypothetical protein
MHQAYSNHSVARIGIEQRYERLGVAPSRCHRTRLHEHNAAVFRRPQQQLLIGDRGGTKRDGQWVLRRLRPGLAEDVAVGCVAGGAAVAGAGTRMATSSAMAADRRMIMDGP